MCPTSFSITHQYLITIPLQVLVHGTVTSTPQTAQAFSCVHLHCFSRLDCKGAKHMWMFQGVCRSKQDSKGQCCCCFGCLLPDTYTTKGACQTAQNLRLHRSALEIFSGMCFVQSRHASQSQCSASQPARWSCIQYHAILAPRTLAESTACSKVAATKRGKLDGKVNSLRAAVFLSVAVVLLVAQGGSMPTGHGPLML